MSGYRPACGRVSSQALRVFVISAFCGVLAACGTTGGKVAGGGDSGSGGGGRYYQDDGPPRSGAGPDPDSVPDAVPRNEPLSRTGNAPYTALGLSFTPMRDARGYRKVGYASWYGRKYHGNRTSSGEPYDMFSMTAAHPVLPLPTYVQVRNLANNRTVVVKVNDRGPFLGGREIDLSYMAARKLGMVESGTARVEVRTVYAGDVPEPQGTRRLASSDPSPAAAAPAPVATAVVASPPVSEPVSANPPETPMVRAVVASMVPAAHAAPTQMFLLQAGSFASRDNAQRLVIRLHQGGYENVRIEPVQVTGIRYHRVQIGPFATPESASQAGASVEAYLKAPVSIVAAGSGL
jgi:rare lipoprotein A